MCYRKMNSKETLPVAAGKGGREGFVAADALRRQSVLEFKACYDISIFMIYLT